MRFSRHLEIGQFLAELKELRVLAFPPNDSVLERLERQRILVPRLRLRYPDAIERRWYAMERPGYPRPRPMGPKEPNGPRWKAACALERARQKQGQKCDCDPLTESNPLDSSKKEWRQFIQFPAKRNFVSWTDFRVRVDGKRSGPLWQDRTAVTYYSTWQLLLFLECHDMGTRFFGNTENWDWRSGQIPESWAGGGIQFEQFARCSHFENSKECWMRSLGLPKNARRMIIMF